MLRLVLHLPRRLFARRERPFGGVGLVEKARKFVDGHETADLVAKRLANKAGIVSEGFGALLRLPSAPAIFTPLGQVPVKERHPRLNAGGMQCIDEPLVEINALGVWLARPVGTNAGPG